MIGLYDEMVWPLRRSHQRARKQHRCGECQRTIDAGETYLVTVYPWKGELTTDRCCAHCEVGREWLRDECSGYIYGEVLADIAEHVESRMYGRDLARLAAGMRRKWRTVHGTLMPVPTMPRGAEELLEAER